MTELKEHYTGANSFIIVLHSGANVNSSKSEETALHHAARGETANLINLLVEFGGNTQARDRRGCKPMDYTKPSTPAGTCLKAYGSKATSRWNIHPRNITPSLSFSGGFPHPIW